MSRKYEFDENLITCSICLEIYNDNNRMPMLLTTCSHTFCVLCLNQQNHRCALCRTPLTSNSFVKNLTIIELLNAKNEYERIRPSTTISVMPPPPPPSSTTALLGNNEDKIKVFIVSNDLVHKWTHPLETTNPLNRQLEKVKKNSIISGVVVDNHCGVFLKLELQSQYVAIRRIDSDCDICKEIPFEKMNCIYTNKHIFALRNQPDYNPNCRYEPELSFQQGSYFISRGRTIGEHKDVFVRVKHYSSGKYGWLFITREGEDCLEFIKTGDDLRELERELPRLEADSQRKQQAEEVRKRQAEEARKREEEEARKREEEIRRREAEEARAELQRQRLLKGKSCTWSLTYHEYIPDDMTDYKCVAIGESGYACVDYFGNVRCHGLPSNVLTVLRNQHLKNVDYIAICCCEYDDEYRYYNGYDSDDDVMCEKYFVQKINGKQYSSNLSSSLTNTIKENGRVETLVLGPDDEYYVKFLSGSEYFAGLDDKAMSILRSYRIITIWIGASSSYYIKYYDGNRERVSYKNLPKGLQKYTTNSNMNIRQMLYDKKSETYFVRYN